MLIPYKCIDKERSLTVTLDENVVFRLDPFPLANTWNSCIPVSDDNGSYVCCRLRCSSGPQNSEYTFDVLVPTAAFLFKSFLSPFP